MTDRARYLLRAADSKRHKSEPEDRLTEILREVLITAPDLAAWLVEKAFGVSESQARRCCGYGDYEVDTQIALPGGGQPDMELRFAGSSLPGRLYCENKIGADFTKLQGRGYPSVRSLDRIIVLSPDGRRPKGLAPEEEPKFVPLRWTDLARAADRIGRSWCGLGWRTDAMRPDVDAAYRLLAEFLWYLEREEVDVSISRPITGDDLRVLPDVTNAVVRWKSFRDLVLDDLWRRQKHDPDLTKRWEKRWNPEGRKGAREKREGLACSVTIRSGTGWEGVGWPAMSRVSAPKPKMSWQELILSPQATWMNQDTPFVGIGVGLERLPDWSDDAHEWNRLRDAVSAAGGWLGFTNSEKIYRILMARPLTQVVRDDTSLDSQAEETVAWALTALEGLVAIDALA